MTRLKLLLAAAALTAATHATAIPLADAAGDFLATYTGPKNGDLDVLTSEVRLQNGIFNFKSTLGAAIGATTGAFYVFGVDRGAGTARFGALATGVLFDSVVIINNDGTGSVRDLLAGVTTALSPSAISFTGDAISAFVDASLLPTRGFAPEAYTYNLWPRVPGTTAGISDFAPDNANQAVAAVPEPAAWAMMLGGFFLVGATVRGRRTDVQVA